MKRFINGKVVEFEYSAEELAAIKQEHTRAELEERSRPLTEAEVSRMFIMQQINTLEVDDNTALRMKSYYPNWSDIVGKTVEKAGFRICHGGKLWKTRQANYTFQDQWKPGETGTESLFEEVCETHAGTLEDPIPYNGNMELEQGKYYVQEYVIYCCTAGSGQAVYHKLSELVGLYVEVA